MNTNFLTGLIAALLLLLSSCDKAANDNNNVKQNPTPLTTGEMTVVDTAKYKPLYVHPLLAETELNAKHTALGNYGKVLPPPMDRMEAQLLTKSYWVAEFYHDSYGSANQRLAGQGQWLQFNPNGTFVGGHWDKQTHAGAWYLLYDGQKRYLTLDSNVDRLDAKWDLQKINGQRDAMAWVRTPELGPRTPTTIQMKLIELYDMPTRQQFGIAEPADAKPE